ncbi:hypothetical protein M9H77_05312 [Catharanthus roseus]|uniref:Uncharacterized protein n=1 Tax=Catharanthus roseus TaxID=4058 RepID=A0ACC0CGT3_CATRO|nr:hypothetical protein M9H77_05312 [Catharanthus roseus]
MEQPQQQQNTNNVVVHEEGISKSSSNFQCRQSTTRWTPTTEQIRILKELYYNNGVRSPSAEQIQKISAKLRQYGKIEGKNVFYWFQNHKARERQKKRLITTSTDHHHHHHHQILLPNNNNNNPIHQRPPNVWRSDHQDHHHHPNIFTTFNPTAGAASSQSGSSVHGLHGFNQHLGNYNYGSLAMEKSFRYYDDLP